MTLIRSLILAFTTYSRLPMPQVEWSEENRKYVMCFFPLIGAVIGLCLWAWLWLCERFSFGPLPRGAVSAVIPLLISGGIHMDGLMDTMDALSSWQSREKKLEILHDSRVGAFAVMSCCGYLLLFAGLLSEASAKDGPALGLCFVLSRTLSAWALTVFRGARQEGMLDSFARASRRRIVTLSGIGYVLLCLAGWSIFSDLPTALLCMAAAGLCLLYYRQMAYRQFGGVTGDLAGWFSQITELACVAMVILGTRIG